MFVYSTINTGNRFPAPSPLPRCPRVARAVRVEAPIYLLVADGQRSSPTYCFGASGKVGPSSLPTCIAYGSNQQGDVGLRLPPNVRCIWLQYARVCTTYHPPSLSACFSSPCRPNLNVVCLPPPPSPGHPSSKQVCCLVTHYRVRSCRGISFPIASPHPLESHREKHASMLLVYTNTPFNVLPCPTTYCRKSIVRVSKLTHTFYRSHINNRTLKRSLFLFCRDPPPPPPPHPPPPRRTPYASLLAKNKRYQCRGTSRPFVFYRHFY